MSNNQFTNKDLHAIEDQLTAESLLVKKFETAAQTCGDADIKNLCTQSAQMHRDHFNKLFNILNSQG
jgi:hypothetical protein